MLLSHEEQYQAGWSELRRRNYIWLGLSLACIPGAALSAYLIPAITSVDGFWIGAPWAAIFVGAAWHRATFPCPRCGRSFFFNAFHNPFARRCMHCGLKIGAPYEAPHASS